MSLGPVEILLIGGAILLILGPKRLPELAKGMGKGIRDFKRALRGEDEKEISPPKDPSKKQE